MRPSLRLIALLVIGAPLWLVAGAIPGGWLAGVLYLAALAMACLWDRVTAPRKDELAIHRELPPRFAFDEDHSVTVVIRNASRHALHVRVRDELPESLDAETQIHHGHLPAGGEARLTYTVHANRRGAYQFGRVVVRLEHGLRLVQRQLAYELPDRIRIYPKFRGVDDYRLLARIAQRDEVVRRPRLVRGAGTDFESLRPYLPGEDLRHVDWKASARRTALISRNRQVEKGQQLAVLLDVGRLMGETIGPYPKLEHAMNATVMLSHVVQKRGDSLAVVSFSNRIESFMPTTRGALIMPMVLESIYNVQVRPVESDYWQVIAEAMSLLRRRSLVIMLTDVLDAAGSAGLINNLARASARHLVLCVVLSEPRVIEIADSASRNVDEVYRKAAAADLVRRRRLALEHMRSRGILVLETDPRHLSVNLVRRYLEIRHADLQ